MHTEYCGICPINQQYKNLISVLYLYSSKNCVRCFYEIIDRHKNRSVTCEESTHLQDCEDEKCKDGTFKCPQYYCVHLRYVCDGFWDCPFGYDESQCIKTAREGFFHCKSSMIFIVPNSVCDKIIDCPLRDDEIACDIAWLPCPETCFCLVYAMSCHLTTENVFTQVKDASVWPHIYLQLHSAYFFSRYLDYSMISKFSTLEHLIIVK